MTSMFLAKVIPLVSLFISGAWAQFDMAKCGTGYEWVRTDARRYDRSGLEWFL